MEHFLAMEEQTFYRMKHRMTIILKALKVPRLRQKNISTLNHQSVIKEP
jgi:hypothetical protein